MRQPGHRITALQGASVQWTCRGWSIPPWTQEVCGLEFSSFYYAVWSSWTFKASPIKDGGTRDSEGEKVPVVPSSTPAILPDLAFLHSSRGASSAPIPASAETAYRKGHFAPHGHACKL